MCVDPAPVTSSPLAGLLDTLLDTLLDALLVPLLDALLDTLDTKPIDKQHATSNTQQATSNKQQATSIAQYPSDDSQRASLATHPWASSPSLTSLPSPSNTTATRQPLDHHTQHSQHNQQSTQLTQPNQHTPSNIQANRRSILTTTPHTGGTKPIHAIHKN